MTKADYTVVVCLLVSLFGNAHAATLRVAPAQFVLHDLEPGKSYDIYKETGLRFTLYNDDDVSRIWVLSTHRPSERGRWEKGFTEIPNATWCRFDQNEITVGAKSAGYGYLFVKIPPGEAYYNQHWMMTVSITGRPGAGAVSLAVDVRVGIETKSKQPLDVRPDGLIGLVPSTVKFDGLVPGRAARSVVTLYNNDSRTHTYTVGSLFEDPKNDTKTYLTPAHRPIPAPGWLDYVKSVRIEQNAAAQLEVRLTVPEEKANFEMKWEDCLLVQPDEGRAGFLRVQVETVAKTAPAKR